MDQNIIYYIASVLDPRLKGFWIQKEHPDGDNKLANVRQAIHEQFWLATLTTIDPRLASLSESNASLDLLLEVINKIRTTRKPTSNIDSYFDSLTVEYNGQPDPD